MVEKLAENGFEQLHCHSHFSVLDGFGMPSEYAEQAKKNNQRFLCITDHGMMGVVPQLFRACDDHNIFPLIGCELYVNRYQPTIRGEVDYKKYIDSLSPEEKDKLKKSYHLLAIAYNNVGYSNLVQLSTWSHANGNGGFPRRPRVTYEQLMARKEGIIFTSCCYMGEIGQAFDRFGSEAAYEVLHRYHKMFGENFYLELMLLDFKKQKPFDVWLVEAHQKTGIPLIVTCDCHYCFPEDHLNQRNMLMTRNKKTLKDIEAAIAAGADIDNFFELQDKNLWYKSERELNEKYLSDYSDAIPYDLFCSAKANTVKICERAKGVQLDRSIKLPQIPDADQKLKDLVMQGFKWRQLPKDDLRYVSQLRREYELITYKGFSSYFLIKKMMTDEARRICPQILGWGTGEEALGPGRGSCPGFLTCYCLGITDVDPIKHDLLPERFLSEARGGKQAKLKFNTEPVWTGVEVRGKKYLFNGEKF